MTTSSKACSDLIYGELKPDILMAPFVLKKIRPAILFSLGKGVGLANPFLISLFPSQDLEKRGLFQVGQGVLPFPVDP